MTQVSLGNIKGLPLMRQSFVVHDTELLFDMGTVVLACEVKVRRYNRAFRNAAEHHNRVVFFNRSAVQVAVPREWETYNHSYRLTRGLAGINPSRYLNVVFCPRQHTIYGSIHMTNGAFNSKRKRAKRWRRRAWFRQQARARRLVERWHQRGWNVVIGGDMNRLRPPEFHPDQQVAHKAGIMQIIVIPASNNSARVSRRTTERSKPRSDHPFISANIRFTSR